MKSHFLQNFYVNTEIFEDEEDYVYSDEEYHFGIIEDPMSRFDGYPVIRRKILPPNYAGVASLGVWFFMTVCNSRIKKKKEDYNCYNCNNSAQYPRKSSLDEKSIDLADRWIPKPMRREKIKYRTKKKTNRKKPNKKQDSFNFAERFPEDENEDEDESGYGYGPDFYEEEDTGWDCRYRPWGRCGDCVACYCCY